MRRRNTKTMRGTSTSPSLPLNKLVIPISITFAGTPTSPTVTKAPLKYDKDFAYSLTLDDTHETAYTNMFKLMGGGTAEDAVAYPGLKFTDGCGNDIFFRGTIGYNQVNAIPTDLHINTPSYLWYSPLYEMFKAGWGIVNHSWSHTTGTTNSPGYPGLGVPKYDIEITNNNTSIKNATGINASPQFVIPTGDINYVQPAIDAGILAIYNQAGTGFVGGTAGIRVDNADLIRPLKLLRVTRDDSNSTGANIMNDIIAVAAASVSGVKYWYNDFTHRTPLTTFGGSTLFATMVTYMQYLEANYGKTGSDRIWVASLEEVYEYIRTREDAVISTPVLNGNTLTFNITYTNQPLFRFKNALTLKVSSDQNISSITTPYGINTTFRGTGSNRIINILG